MKFVLIYWHTRAIKRFASVFWLNKTVEARTRGEAVEVYLITLRVLFMTVLIWISHWSIGIEQPSCVRV